MKVISKTCRAH